LNFYVTLSEYSYYWQTFYVDLDLSSLNGVIKPRPQGRRKFIPTASKTVNPAVSTPTPTPAFGETDTGNATPRTPDGDPHPTTPTAAKGRLLEAPEPGSEIQILELQSGNPVISYQNEVYSCTWSDMMGTNMFFSEHDDEMGVDPLRSTEDYDLLGTSRIKLIGRKAKLTDKPGRKGEYGHAAKDVQEEEMDLRSGKGLGTLRSSNPVINRERKKQAKFLENLMDAKRAKGQTDNVRTVYKTSRVPHGGAGSTFTAQDGQTYSEEIEELNRRVVRGDAAALRRLQIIYSEPDEQQPDSGIAQTPAPMPGSTWHGSIDTENANLNQTDNAQST
jgi:hypothetical protein